MGKWVKRIGLGLIAVLLIGGALVYYELKSIGIIPRDIYETTPPPLPELGSPSVLLFDKTNGFIHREAIPVANQVFDQLATAHGWDVFHTANAAVFNSEMLNRFDLVIWNNVSGDVLTVPQRDALRNWIEAGGGWLGVHGSGGDISYQWDWYVNQLIGAQFIGHTMDPQFQDAELIPAYPVNPLTDHLPQRWRVAAEEWYAFDRSPRVNGSEILVVIDEASYAPKGEAGFGFVDTMDGEHPLVWRHRLGAGRVFYSAVGHTAATYQLPEYQTLLDKAMEWCIGEKPQDTSMQEPTGERL